MLVVVLIIYKGQALTLSFVPVSPCSLGLTRLLLVRFAFISGQRFQLELIHFELTDACVKCRVQARGTFPRRLPSKTKWLGRIVGRVLKENLIQPLLALGELLYLLKQRSFELSWLEWEVFLLLYNFDVSWVMRTLL